jgi:ArsR family transcriptional regulator
MEALLQGLRAAAEATRLRILMLCAQGDLSVSDLTQILGQSQPRVSRHLKLMVEGGLLDRFREGTFAFFRVASGGPGAAIAAALIAQIRADDPTVALDLRRLDAVRRERAEAAAAYFRENAARWDEIRALHIGDEAVEAAIAGRLPDAVGDLVDLGTGTGRMLALFAPRAQRAVGIDQSREMLAVARANLEHADLLHRAQVRQGDLYQLPLADGSFDVAVMHHVLHYLEAPETALAEAARILRPGGRLLIVDFAPHDVAALSRDHAHLWPGFADGQMAGWLRRAGLEAEPPLLLPGRMLTVAIWDARRAGQAPARPEAKVLEGVAA